MTINVRMAMMSHLSDAQYLMAIKEIASANKEINFVKMMMHKYPNTEIEVEESELDELWKECCKRFQ